MKRAFDIVVALALLVAFSPIMLATAVLVRIYLGSPVLFTQERPGREMRPFRMYKFRTMKNLRNDQGELLPDQLRQSSLGNQLRKLSVDELPQLLNILKGEMSLVGPRPLLMKYLPYYTEREKLRFLVRPGITGLAQISGRNHLGWNERLELDAQYVEKRSFFLDMGIMRRTVLKVLKQEDIVTAPGVNEPDLDHIREGGGQGQVKRTLLAEQLREYQA